MRRLSLESLESRLVLQGTISGFVHVDADDDGVRDSGERGVPGVVINLTGGASVSRSTMTDDTGFYSFAGLDAGTYQVAERQPPALIDGRDSTAHTAAVAGNDQITNLVLATDQTSAENNFGERGLRAEFVSSRLRLASTSPQVILRETNASAEDIAGNATLATSIRSGAGVIPDDGDDDDDDGGVVNQPFAAVTPGPFDAAGLLGTRTDLVTGAPAISQTHVSTAVSYAGFSNPPTYGPHHPAVGSITPRPTGVYTTEQPDEDLVHNLEHGHVWISYNPTLITPADRTALEQLVTAGGTNTGVILTPRAQNTTAIALASWAHLLTLTSFDAAQIRSFIETNRGHAPEGFIPSGQKAAGAASETLDDGLQHTRSPFQPFPAVTPGSVDDPNLRGTRTDTLPGAAAVSQAHVTSAVDYSTGHSNPPSYGAHHGVVRDGQNNFITPRPTGVYNTEQPDEDLVHNLEHGNVWISYDPGLITPTDKTALEQLVTAGGVDTGVILTPRARNTSAIVLTSWTRQLSLNSFNATTIRDFIVTNRGHSPEGFIPSGQKPANGDTLDDDLDHTPP